MRTCSHAQPDFNHRLLPPLGRLRKRFIGRGRKCMVRTFQVEPKRMHTPRVDASLLAHVMLTWRVRAIRCACAT